MTYFLRKNKKITQRLMILAGPSLILSACKPATETVSKSINNELSLALPTQIGSLNYPLESNVAKGDIIQLLVEPLVKVKPTSAIQPYLTNPNLNTRFYTANDDGVLSKIDFDVNKIQRDQDGFFDPTTDSSNGGDIYEGEGKVRYKSLDKYYAGAADVIVGLGKEISPYATSTNKEDDSLKIANRIIRFHIRDDLKWSNGDPVTPNDYVSTLKYILDPTKGSLEYTEVVNRLQIKNANQCFVERYNLIQQNPNLTGDQTWNQAPSCQSKIDPVDPETNKVLANTGFGVRALDNNWVEYEFEQGDSVTTIASKLDLLGGVTFLPVPEKFIQKLPRSILDYGLDENSFLSNGAFKLTQFSPEYILKAEKNRQYWDQEDVFSQNLTVRTSSNNLVQINLFRDGDISEISNIPPQFLPVFNSDPSISQTIVRGGASAVSSFLQFSASGIANIPGLAPMLDPDFRRALYYGLNRVKTLEAQNRFGLIPSAITIPNNNLDFFTPGDLNLYSYVAKQEMVPDYPGAQPYKLESYTTDDRAINNYANYLGGKPIDNVYKPELAKKFFKRWVDKYKVKDPVFPFQFDPADEDLAISLQQQWESLFADYNFSLKLEPTLSTTLLSKKLTGDFTMTFEPGFTIDRLGTSSYNWYFGYATTTFANDRRLASQTKYFGDTIGAYARRLATTQAGRERLASFGLDPNPESQTKAGYMWRLLQTLDQYIESDSETIKNLPDWNETVKNGILLDNKWKNPTALQKHDLLKNYLFHLGLGIGSNSNYFFFRNNVVIQNPLAVGDNSEFKINNGYLLADFYVILEKLMRDNVFSIPISSYSATYFASRIVGSGRASFFGFPRNLTSAYRFDAKPKNNKNIALPGQEILNS
ncbi:Oligopeptide ABC transporter, substrate-binding protein OppA [[Mycoplasma] cavipharyngis]|uniref:ABC transporter substrate-binding protein n=1 Tax=[Mycoplasma] cavipharyngis TaxID=92757 RepID=UPI0037042372